MKKLHLILLIVGVIGYSCNSELAPGKYSTIKPGRIQRMFSIEKWEGLASGITLTLHADSTYHYETCGIITEGSFSVEANKLILNHESISKRISDSETIPATMADFPFYQQALRFKIGVNKLTANHEGVKYILRRDER